MRRVLLMCLCSAILVSCAARRPSVDLPDISTWEQRQAVLGNVVEWEFRGRIAVKAGDEGFNGKLRWTQNGQEFHATVSGPLGIGTVRIDGDEQTITLTDKDGAQTILTDPEAELYYRYGWTIPVARLPFWALGIPDPALAAVTEVDDEGRMTHLEQSDWVVDISRYGHGGGHEMPRKLTASNSNTRVRLVIGSWLFFER